MLFAVLFPLAFQFVRSNMLKKALLSICNIGSLPVAAKDTSCVVISPCVSCTMPVCPVVRHKRDRSKVPPAPSTTNNAPSDAYPLMLLQESAQSPALYTPPVPVIEMFPVEPVLVRGPSTG